MSQSTVSVRMDEALKQEFDTVCNDLGLSMSTAVTMLAKKMAREKRLPFEVALDPFYSPENQDRKTLKRILLLLQDIDRNGYAGIGKPERLSGDLSSYWSRRIDDANRIVYRIENDVIQIVQCGSHYRDH